jgi:DNA repair protein RadC
MSENYNAENRYFSIKEWQEDDRPREKLVRFGSASLSESELLAILIGSGASGFSALDAAKDMLKKHGGLNKLTGKTLGEIKQTRGIGTVKAITLLAAFELGRRIESAPIDKRLAIKSPDQIYEIFGPKMRNLEVEVFKVLLLSTSNKIIREIDIAKGILNQVLVHPREIFKPAITENAASIIVMHNHPSGKNEPSKEDINLTNTLQKAVR